MEKEHMVIMVSKMLSAKKALEEHKKQKEEELTVRVLEKHGLSLETYMCIQDEIKNAKKEEEYKFSLEDMELSLKEKEDEIMNCLPEMKPYMVESKTAKVPTWNLKLADGTIAYTPGLPYTLDESAMDDIIETLFNLGEYNCITIDAEKYFQLNEKCKKEAEEEGEEFENLPGVIERDYALKSEFKVKKR